MLPATLAALRPLLPESERLLDIGVRLALTVVVAFVIERALFLVIGRTERLMIGAGHGSPHAEQRARTLGQIFRNLATVLVASFAVIYALGVLGWDVKPLLAGAGVLGVALGFGAQTLVRDVIAGVFILSEDQFAVGDLIEVNGRAATVEAISVRCTTLRDFHGFVHFVPNGEMKIVTNRSRGWNRIAVDVPVAADQNLDRALDAVGRVVRTMNEEPAWRDRLLDPIDMWGVEALGSNEAHIRLVLRSHPGADAPETARELRRRVHAALAAAGVRTSLARDISITPLQAGDAPGAPAVPAAAAPPAR